MIGTGDSPGGHAAVPRRVGLHARAIEAMLFHHARRPPPLLAEIAFDLNIDETDLTALFPTQQAVFDAIAEEALLRLVDGAVRAVVSVDPDDALAQFRALGIAYVDWAVQNRAHFLITIDRSLVKPETNPALHRLQQAMRDLTMRLLLRARDQGRIAPDSDLDLLLLSSGAFFYGLARMVVDGLMMGWHPIGDPHHEAQRALGLFVERALAGPPLR